jgi:hypothetical protein
MLRDRAELVAGDHEQAPDGQFDDLLAAWRTANLLLESRAQGPAETHQRIKVRHFSRISGQLPIARANEFPAISASGTRLIPTASVSGWGETAVAYRETHESKHGAR